MNNSINHKIKKYTYKLEHAKNRKEAMLYKAKLDNYKSKQVGGVIKEEELREMINNAFGESEKQIQNLTSEFDNLIEEIKKKCCEKKDCGPEILVEANKLKENWNKILEEISKSKNRTLTEKLETEIEKIKDFIGKITCPPIKQTE